MYFFLSDFMEEWYIFRFIMKREGGGFMRSSLWEGAKRRSMIRTRIKGK